MSLPKKAPDVAKSIGMHRLEDPSALIISKLLLKTGIRLGESFRSPFLTNQTPKIWQQAAYKSLTH